MDELNNFLKKLKILINLSKIKDAQNAKKMYSVNIFEKIFYGPKWFSQWDHQNII